MSAAKPFLCGACNKRFTTHQGVESHIVGTHRRQRRVDIFSRIGCVETGHDDDDDSIASQALAASLDRALGNRLDDHDTMLADMAEGRL